MSNKPTVVMVGPWAPPPGGVGTFMTNIVESRLQDRYGFVRYDISRPEKKKVHDNYGYRAALSGGIGRMFVGGAMTLWRVGKFPFWLLWRRPEIVQVHASDFFAYWEAVVFVALSRLVRRPVMMRLGGSFNYFYASSSDRAKSLIRRTLQWPDRVIVQSPYWRDFVAGLGRAQGVVVLPNAVPDELAVPFVRPQRDRPLCLYAAGSEAVRKGVNEVLGAMQRLGEREVPIAIRIVALTPSLRERIEAERPAVPIRMEGYLEPAAMMDAMRDADIFLLPSYGEGFPNALLEAMANGLASVVTPVGAVPEMVGADGAIVIAKPDPELIAGAITRLVREPDVRRRIGERANAIVRERYVESVVLTVIDDAWQELINGRARR